MRPLFGNRGTAPSIMGVRKTQQTTCKAKSPQVAAKPDRSRTTGYPRATSAQAKPIKQINEETRSTETMFDMDTFERAVYAPFAQATRNFAGITASARNGVKMAKEDLAKGYMDGNTLKETEADLNARRIKAQKDFKSALDGFNAKSREMVESAFTLRPGEVNGLELTLSLLGDTDEDYMNLAKQYAGSFTALKAIAGAAKRNGATNYGNRLDAALNDYREVTTKVACGGLGESATKGVFGTLGAWDTAASMKLDSVREARSRLDQVTGTAPVKKNELQEAMDALVFSR